MDFYVKVFLINVVWFFCTVWIFDGKPGSNKIVDFIVELWTYLTMFSVPAVVSYIIIRQ